MFVGRWVSRAGRPVITGLLLAAGGCSGSGAPVSWTAELEEPSAAAPGSVVRVLIDARIDRGWYFYSVTQPAGGPVPARIFLADTTTFRAGGSVEGPVPARSFDRTFGMNVEKYVASPSFILPVRIPADVTAGATDIRVSALYQACNDTICLSPAIVTLSVPVKIRGN